MKIVKFQTSTKDQWGVLDGETIRSIEGDPFNGIDINDETHSLSDVTLLAPISPLNKVPAIAANYGVRDDRDGPGIFMKQPGTYQRHEGNIVFPRSCKTVIHEAEVGIVISKVARHIDEKNALDYVFGYTCVNDVTAMDLVKKDSTFDQWTRAKSFDTFGVFGPCVVSDVDPMNLRVTSKLNGKIVQDYNTSDMFFNVFEIVSYLSKDMTLFPGDIIACGTNSGLGPMSENDIIEIEIQGIGKIVNKLT